MEVALAALGMAICVGCMLMMGGMVVRWARKKLDGDG
jgi:hypothetical protein